MLPWWHIKLDPMTCCYGDNQSWFHIHVAIHIHVKLQDSKAWCNSKVSVFPVSCCIKVPMTWLKWKWHCWNNILCHMQNSHFQKKRSDFYDVKPVINAFHTSKLDKHTEHVHGKCLNNLFQFNWMAFLLCYINKRVHQTDFSVPHGTLEKNYISNPTKHGDIQVSHVFFKSVFCINWQSLIASSACFMIIFLVQLTATSCVHVLFSFSSMKNRILIHRALLLFI